MLLAVATLICVFEVSAQKKPLDHDVYDSWESVRTLAISGDGDVVVYLVSPQEGDGRLVFHRLSTGQETGIDRATGVRLPKDAGFAAFTVKAPFAETRQAKIDKKKSDEMPRDSVAYIDLKTFEVTNLGPAKSFKTGYSSAPYIFVETYTDKAKDQKKDSSGTKSRLPEGDGFKLLVVNTATGKADTLRDVCSYYVSKSGEKLAAVVEKPDSDTTLTKAVKFYDFPAGLSAELSEGKEDYCGFVFNDGDDRLLFMATDQDEEKDGTPAYSIYVATETEVKRDGRTISVEELVTADAEGLPEGWIITEESEPEFSNSSGRIVMELYRHVPPKDTTVVDFEAAGLDIWVWNSIELPPMSKATILPYSESLTAVVDMDRPGRLLPLSLNPNDYITLPGGADADFAISNNTDKYALEDLWNVNMTGDYSIIDLKDGSRTPIVEGLTGNVRISPDGAYLLWFNPKDGNYYSKNVLEGGDFVNLTGRTGYPFYDEINDMPTGYLPVGYPDWSEDGKYVYLNDRYDVWKFSLDGKTAVNLTAGHGRENLINYSISSINYVSNPYLYSSRAGIADGTLYLDAFGEEDMRSGFALAGTSRAGAPSGFTAEYKYNSASKAENSNTLVYLKGNFRNPMDVYVSKDFGVSDTRLSEINPQQDDYLWGDVQLVTWNAYDGTPLKGLLYTPENLDPSGKYPMLVYFYSRSSDGLYNYHSPAPSRSIINIPFYVSRGYVVFVPDIVYEAGHPGESAYNCICSGVEAMCESFSFIDRERMALQGQSWGGYQTAYLVTRTDMFAAAGAGAPVGNMTSAYGGIRWESGNSRITQYEFGQSRIGKNLWEEGALELYIENSPVFFADKVNTPVLIMHNDADGAVPWYQGIELFMSLRRLGKPVWLLQYNNEQHNLVERRNTRDLSIRMQQFFDYYLMGAPEPVWMKSGIPYARKGNYFGYEYVEQDAVSR